MFRSYGNVELGFDPRQAVADFYHSIAHPFNRLAGLRWIEPEGAEDLRQQHFDGGLSHVGRPLVWVHRVEQVRIIDKIPLRASE